MSCVIDKGFAFDCADLPIGGIAKFAMLYNLEDWQAATKTLSVANAITNIVNDTGLRAYKVEAADETNIIPSITPRTVDGGYTGYNDQLIFSVFENDQLAVNAIDKLRFAPVVAIVYQNSGTGLVYGETGGMYMTNIEHAPASPDLGAVRRVTIATTDRQPAEPYQPRTIDAGTPASTLALIQGLTTPGA